MYSKMESPWKEAASGGTGNAQVFRSMELKCIQKCSKIVALVCKGRFSWAVLGPFWSDFGAFCCPGSSWGRCGPWAMLGLPLAVLGTSLNMIGALERKCATTTENPEVLDNSRRYLGTSWGRSCCSWSCPRSILRVSWAIAR